MKILGLHFESHDSGVALLDDGKILYVANEERFSRFKADLSAPLSSLKDCLRYTNTLPQDIDIITISGFPLLKKFYYFGWQKRKMNYFTKGKTLLGFYFLNKKKYMKLYGLKALLLNLITMTSAPQIAMYLNNYQKLKKIFNGFKGRFEYVDHHTAHLSSAYYTSGFKDCLSLVIEGNDFQNATVFDVVENGKIKPISKSPFPHSPGNFYILITLMFGYNHLLHAGKITGLAAYGNPKNAYGKVKDLLYVDGMNLKLSPKVYNLQVEYLKTRKIPNYFSGYSKEDLAAAFQKRLEDCAVKIVKRAYDKTKKKNLILTGGVVANVKLNQRIHELGLFDEIIVHPHMGDGGLALGASLRTNHLELERQGKKFVNKRIDHVYFGPDFTNDDIKKSLDNANLKYKRVENIEEELTKLLEKGHVVARFDGRMEYGPRALGNRSILYQATDSSVNDWLNKRLDRTEFMPFAPYTLIEDVNKCYENVKGAEHTSKFMTMCFDCTPLMKKMCPAVVHVDGTARPQFISKEDNPSYYKILEEYKKRTGLLCLINTSFNMHGEPIVCTPDDAVKSFLNGHLDYLAIGNYLVKNPSVNKDYKK